MAALAAAAASPTLRAHARDTVLPVTNKSPTLKRTGDTMVDNRSQLQRNTLMIVCGKDKMWADTPGEFCGSD